MATIHRRFAICNIPTCFGYYRFQSTFFNVLTPCRAERRLQGVGIMINFRDALLQLVSAFVKGSDSLQKQNRSRSTSVPVRASAGKLRKFTNIRRIFTMATSAIGNGTADSWQSEPNTRGTWGILLNCIVTTTLAVYSALHLNVARQGNEQPWFWYQRAWKKEFWVYAKCIGLGIFAPELVVYTAWVQHDTVKEMTAQISKLYYKVWTISIAILLPCSELRRVLPNS